MGRTSEFGGRRLVPEGDVVLREVVRARLVDVSFGGVVIIGRGGVREVAAHFGAGWRDSTRVGGILVLDDGVARVDGDVGKGRDGKRLKLECRRRAFPLGRGGGGSILRKIRLDERIKMFLLDVVAVDGGTGEEL
jgi:hypothetical protein